MSTEQKPHETEHKPLRRDCCLDDYSVLLGGKKIRSEHFLLEFVQLRKYILKFFLKRTFKKENEINTRNALCGEKCLLTLILCSDLKCVRNDMRAAAVYVCSSSILSLQFTHQNILFFSTARYAQNINTLLQVSGNTDWTSSDKNSSVCYKAKSLFLLFLP